MPLLVNYVRSTSVHSVCNVLSLRLQYALVFVFGGIRFHTVKKLHTVVKVEHCLCVAISSVDFVIHSRGKEMKVKGQGLRVKIYTTFVSSEII
jgi:hypothetical protein